MARRLAPLVAALVLLLGAAAGAAGQTAPPGSIYIALGDSVAAGHGLGSPTDQSDAEACTRSQDAYPGLLRESPYFTNPLGAGGSVACSGAVSANLIDVPQTVAPDGEDPVTMRPQIEVIRSLGLAPSRVTITVGANDVGYLTVLDACLAQDGSGPEGPCAQQAPRVAHALLSLSANLGRLIDEVAALPGPQRIMMTGYYDPFPADLTNIGQALACGVLGTSIRTAQLDGDFELMQTYLRLLNGVIARAASDAGVQYVDLSTVLEGHRLCSRAPWVVPPSTATLGDGTAFHPNAFGQEAIAQKLVLAVGGTVPHITDGPQSAQDPEEPEEDVEVEEPGDQPEGSDEASPFDDEPVELTLLP